MEITKDLIASSDKNITANKQLYENWLDGIHLSHLCIF